MTLRALWKPALLYTGALSLLTVGTIQVATHSGVAILFSAGGGLVLVALSVGNTGPADGGGFETDRGLDATGGWLHAETDAGISLPLLFYGFGVFLWSAVLMITVYDVLA